MRYVVKEQHLTDMVVVDTKTDKVIFRSIDPDEAQAKADSLNRQ